MSDLTCTLRKLLDKDVLSQWTDNYEKLFKELENNISCDARHQYFKPSKPVILQVDASKRGLGAVLIQEDTDSKDKPVANASKSLTSLETRYVNIE